MVCLSWWHASFINLEYSTLTTFTIPRCNFSITVIFLGNLTNCCSSLTVSWETVSCDGYCAIYLQHLLHIMLLRGSCGIVFIECSSHNMMYHHYCGWLWIVSSLIDLTLLLFFCIAQNSLKMSPKTSHPTKGHNCLTNRFKRRQWDRSPWNGLAQGKALSVGD